MHMTIEETREYIGMWETKDGNIHHEYCPTTVMMKPEETEKVPTKVIIG